MQRQRVIDRDLQTNFSSPTKRKLCKIEQNLLRVVILCAEIIFDLVLVFSFGFLRCGLVGAGPDCELIEDLTLPYPACCPTIRCSKTSGESEDTRPDELHILSRPNNIQPSR